MTTLFNSSGQTAFGFSQAIFILGQPFPKAPPASQVKYFQKIKPRPPASPRSTLDVWLGATEAFARAA